MIFHQPNNSKGNYSYNVRKYVNDGYAPHFHKNFELIYVSHGFPRVQIGNKEYNPQKDQCILVVSNQIHGFTVPSDACIYVAVFSTEYVPKFASLINGLEPKDPVFTPSGSVLALLKEQVLENRSDLLMRKACFYALCSEIYNKCELVPRNDEKEDTVIRILDWISENYTSNISLSDVAREFGYEYHYLSRLLNQNYNINFNQLVNGYRTERAVELLLETDLPITQIVMQSGFQSIRNFNLVFHKIIGKRPCDYRKNP